MPAQGGIEVAFKPVFIRQFNKCEPALQDEIEEKIDLFRNRKNHSALRVHKLHGPLSGRWSFSVNYRYRVVFVWETAKSAVLLALGDHAVYEK